MSLRREREASNNTPVSQAWEVEGSVVCLSLSLSTVVRMSLSGLQSFWNAWPGDRSNLEAQSLNS